ncbi:MAG: winged helix-turn-helix domain-containing protein [Chromatiaceae bacterium]|nr:winged helix-turn-helix domain-containing protein [Chromatiaceae bacterium]
MNIKPDKPLQVGDWQYLPEQDKLVQFDAAGKIAVTAELDNLSQKVANYFIANAGKLITKDELLQDVWGIRDVSDGRVTRVIRVLRVALGDDTREPTYIETIPKRGYRFIAPVTEIVQAEEVEQSESADQGVLKQTRRQNWPAAAVLSAVFSLFIAASVWWLWPQAEDEAEQSIPLLRYKPVTALDGLEFYHNASEDGRYLVYSYASPQNESITVLMLEDLLDHKRIIITDDIYSSFGASFSPDGKQIAYHRAYQEGGCSIRLIDFDQQSFSVSNDIELSKCAEKSPSSRPVWSMDGKYIVYSAMNASRKMVLMMTPVEGGGVEQLTNPPPSTIGDYAARFSFDGNKLVFLRATGTHAQLWLLDIASRELKLLLNVLGTLPGNVAWSADSRYVIYPSSPTVLSKVDIVSGVSEVIAYTDLSTEEIQTLSNGRTYSTVGNFSHTNIKELANPLVSPVQSSAVVYSSNRNESHAEANPVAGGPLAAVSRRSGLPQVWLFYPEGTQRQLTFFEENKRIRTLLFAPNGKDLLLQLHNELWLLSDQGVLTKIPHSSDNILYSPAWGKSGRYIYFAESLNSRWQISRYDLDKQVVEPFALDQELYLESYDGKYSFWRDGITKKFYVKFSQSGQIEEVPITFPNYQLWFQFRLKDDGVYFTHILDDIYYELMFYNFKTKQKVNVLEEQVLTHSRFSVSADSSKLYILEAVRGDLDIATLELP